jgi:K+-transporting ATPase KdpF subunit
MNPTLLIASMLALGLLGYLALALLKPEKFQ